MLTGVVPFLLSYPLPDLWDPGRDVTLLSLELWAGSFIWDCKSMELRLHSMEWSISRLVYPRPLGRST